MNVISKTKIANVVLWCAYVLALAASVSHLAWAFGTLEFSGSEWVGWLAAISVDAGLAALAYGIQQRKRARRGARYLWVGVVVLSGISAFANLLHGLTATTGEAVRLATFTIVDTLALAKAIVLSASLPILVVYLGEVVSSDDAQAAAQAAKDLAKAERAAARQAESESQHSARTVVLAQPRDPLEQARAIRKQQAEEAISALLAFYASNPGATQEQAGKAVARSRQWVGAVLTRLEQEGKICRNGNGVEVLATGYGGPRASE